MAHPDWREMINNIMRERNISQRALSEVSGIHRTRLRSALSNGDLFYVADLQAVLAVLDLQLVIRPINKDDDA